MNLRAIGIARAVESTKDMQSIFEEIARSAVGGSGGVEGRGVV